MEHLEDFCYWIRERENIRLRKEGGAPRPWTTDPILKTFHFCNVRREDDRGTREIRALGVRQAVECLPEYYTMCRLFNSAKTMEAIEGLTMLEATAKLKAMRAAGETVFNTAYVVSTCGKSMDKIDYVMGVVQKVHETGIPSTSCEDAYNALVKIDGLGSFLAAQVVADLKNDRYLVDAPDWETFSSIGPGSKKGLDFLFAGGTTPSNYELRMCKLEAALPQDIQDMRLHRQDLQNCLCEFSKYMRYKQNLPGRRRPYK